MAIVISQTQQRAKKEHSDDGDQYFDDEIIGITLEELQQIQHSKNNGWRIKPGEIYIRQAVVECSDFYVFKCRKEIFDIISKYRLFEEY